MDNIRAVSAESEKSHGILVVDDDVHVLKLVSRMLGSLGHAKVFQAASVDEAQAIWKEQRGSIGLVISDFVMPQKTGDVMALEMRKESSALKVLLISGNDPHGLDSLIPLQPGLNFLQKPFTVAEMRKSIEGMTQCS